MFQIRFAIFLTLALSFCLPATLTAQPPEGEFVILSAQYGTEFHQCGCNVARRLREAARHERMIIWTTGRLGLIRKKGVPKMLRIYARGPEGHERMFEYREGSGDRTAGSSGVGTVANGERRMERTLGRRRASRGRRLPYF